MKKVIFIKGNLIHREVRFPKIIYSLAENGYEVMYIGWDRNNRKPDIVHHDPGKKFNEINFNRKAPWGNKILFYLPLWWYFVFIRLVKNEWDIVTAGELISLPPAILAGKLLKRPVIYDMADVYEDQITLPKIIRSACIRVDKLFMWLSSAVTLADYSQIMEVNGIPNTRIVAIYDSPPDIEWKSEKVKNKKYTLFFAGQLTQSRQLNLDKVIAACEALKEVQLIIAGYGDMTEDIKKKSAECPEKIVYLGELSHKEVLEQSRNADLLFVLRNPIVPVNKYICGSKVFEAMMCGIPMMVNQGTSTAEIVAQEDFGVIIDGNNTTEILDAIKNLMSKPDLCTHFSENARNAYERRYNWEIMQSRLLNLYADLANDDKKFKSVES